MTSTRTISRLLLAAFLVSTGLALAGCEDTKMMEMFDGKKKLPGDRKQVFPEGIPGVQQGVPPELMKGYRSPEQMSQTPADPNGLAPAPAPVAAAEPPRARTAAVAPSAAADNEKGGVMVGARAAGQPEAPKPKRVAKPKPKPQPVAASAPPQQEQPVQQEAPPQAATRPWPGSTPSGPPSDRFSR
jgi:hypothetical protein